MLQDYVVRLCLGSLLLISANAFATMMKPITSPIPAPPARVLVEPPAGYASCDVIPAAWTGKVWAPLRQECHYPNAANVAVWVSGYWGCTLAKGSACKHWVWHRSHWAKVPLKREAYYNHRVHEPIPS